jgi:hypothetical protein
VAHAAASGESSGPPSVILGRDYELEDFETAPPEVVARLRAIVNDGIRAVGLAGGIESAATFRQVDRHGPPKDLGDSTPSSAQFFCPVWEMITALSKSGGL